MELSTIALFIGGAILLYFSLKLLIIALIVAGIYYGLKYTEHFNQIRFLTKAQTQELIREDRDKYISSMSIVDLYARRVDTPEQYMEKASAQAMDFTKSEKDRITILVNNIKYVDLKRFGIDMKKWNEIPYIFAKCNYEDQYPHTRNDVIILNDRTINRSDDELLNTIVHEKVHVYQKMYPNDILLYLTRVGYKKVGEKSMYPLARSNPDIDNNIYMGPNGKIHVGEYNSSTPRDIWDINTTSEGEHPLELMAYTIANMH